MKSKPGDHYSPEREILTSVRAMPSDKKYFAKKRALKLEKWTEAKFEDNGELRIPLYEQKADSSLDPTLEPNIEICCHFC